MAKYFEVMLTGEHLSRVAKVSAMEALREFIWNSCDADAKNISITIETGLGSALAIVIEDDGHGINYEDIDALFGNFGRSVKALNRVSPEGRVYHGRLGEGRYKGFSIGNRIEWVSRYKSSEGVYEFSVSCDSTNMKRLTVSDKIEMPQGSKTGVRVEISNLREKLGLPEDKTTIIYNLNAAFAAYLIAYKNIVIKLDGRLLNPEENIKNIRTIEITAQDKSDVEHAEVKIIEWNNGDMRGEYTCGQKGVSLEEINLRFNRHGFPVSVYILSSYFDDLHDKNLLSMGATFPIYESLLNQAENLAREYIKEKLLQLAAEEVESLKTEDIYPYKGDASNVVEQAERQVFDICAIQVHQYLPNFSSVPKKTKQLTYRLIQQALASNPGSLKKILSEVMDLSKEKQDDLANLLEKTTLSAIINTATIVSNRMLFLNGLGQILYDNEYNKRLKERSQLHKILLNELWIFGEQYSYGVDDVNLRNVLKEYIRHMGREELIPRIAKDDISNLDEIPDICLWQQYPHQYETVENLIIELKRPKCILGKDELGQIDEYWYRITANKHFPKESTRWNFLLIGTDYDDFVAQKLANTNNLHANYFSSADGKVRVWVRKWNQVIQDAKLKLEFLREKLDYQIQDNEEGINYLENKYSEYFPGKDVRLQKQPSRKKTG